MGASTIIMMMMMIIIIMVIISFYKINISFSLSQLIFLAITINPRVNQNCVNVSGRVLADVWKQGVQIEVS